MLVPDLHSPSMLRGERKRTAHNGSYARDQVDDLGLDAGIGAGSESWVVGYGGEVDYKRARISR